MMDHLTARKLEALKALASLAYEPSPSEFAQVFWPEKHWQRINGPYGLGPDSSGLHGGRMLESLRRMDLVDHTDHKGYYTYRVSRQGWKLLEHGVVLGEG